MTDWFSHSRSRPILNGTICLLAGILIFCIGADAKSTSDEVKFLQVQNKPLSQVLQQLSQISGYTFTYDAEWADLNITVRVKSLSLEKTLRKILANMNFAIVYQADDNIKIRIYGKAIYERSHDQAGNERPNTEQSATEKQEVNSDAINANTDTEAEQTEKDAETDPGTPGEPREGQDTDTEEKEDVTDENELASEEINESETQGVQAE